VSLTRVTPNIIAVANNVTNKTVGNTTSIPSFTFDGAGVVTSASNVAISGAGITANTVANSAFQTGSIENYSRATGLLSGMRNRIINGAMVFDQRNAGASVTPAGSANTYTLDRFAIYCSQSSKLTVQQSTTAPTGFTNSYLVTSLSAYSVTSSDEFNITQAIEGFNFSDMAWGTANAKTITISFWVRSSLTGTFGGALRNASVNRNYPFSYTILTANTFEYKTITIAGDTSGTWTGATNGVAVYVGFSVGAGSSASGTAGAWAAGNIISATGATSVVGTNGATFYITGVQLEVGSTATSFDYRPYGTELALCQRYYYLIGKGSSATSEPMGVGYYLDGSTVSSVVSFPVTMRTEPTLSATSGTDYYSCYRNAGQDFFNSLSLDIASPNYIGMFNNTQASGTSGQAGIFFISSGQTNAQVAVSAEL